MQLLTIIAVPLSGVIIAFIANKRSNRETDDTVSKPEQAKVMTEGQAQTAELSLIFEGFTASHRALTEDFARVRQESKDCRETTEELKARFKLAERARLAERRIMINHIEMLEALIPVPPGPPTRPSWDQ
jgi:hypothetical protein